MSFSCISQKGLFITLFKSISIKQKSEFIDKVINIRNNKQETPVEEEEDSLEREDLKDALYAQVNILKTLVSLKSILPENSQIKMLNFILMEYFSNRNNSFQEVINYLEDKLVLFYWCLNATTQIEKNDEDDLEKSDRGLIKGILKFNKHLNTLIKTNAISIEEEDYKVFKKSLIDINGKIKEKHTFKNEKKKVFNDAIIKILIIVQVLYLRNPSDLNDTLFDLSELLNKTISKNKLDDKFDTVFTEICLQLISLGSHMLSDYTLKIFRKVSAYLERNSVDVLVSFIKS